MTRMKTTWYGQTGTDLDGNPMAKVQTLLAEERPQRDVPFREVVEKKTSSRFQNPHAFTQPCFTPNQVIGPTVITTLTVFLAEIERWISEDGIDGLIAKTGQ